MPKLAPDQHPSYRFHKKSGLAVVTLAGQDKYLGKYDSPESRKKYDALIADWIRDGRLSVKRDAPMPPADEVTVTEILTPYFEDVVPALYGADAAHVGHFRAALRVVRQLYGTSRANAFDSVALKKVREGFVSLGWSRNYCNQQTQRVQQMFRWAQEQRHVDPTPEILSVTVKSAIKQLKKGKSGARETPKVQSVSDSHIDQVLEFSSPTLGAMIRLQRLTGMRPGEVCQMRGAEIERPENDPEGLWYYKPAQHKTAHLDVERIIALGARAQALLQPFLSLDPSAPLFRPSESLAWLHRRRLARKLGMTMEQLAKTRPEPRRTKWKAGDEYDTHGYRQAIEYACTQAFPLPAELAPRMIPKSETSSSKGEKRESEKAWKARLTPAQVAAAAAWRKAHRFHPHQIRHTFGTDIERHHGRETAKASLGHTSLTATAIYIDKDHAASRKIAKLRG